jgi:hypothetical protein
MADGCRAFRAVSAFAANLAGLIYCSLALRDECKFLFPKSQFVLPWQCCLSCSSPSAFSAPRHSHGRFKTSFGDRPHHRSSCSFCMWSSSTQVATACILTSRFSGDSYTATGFSTTVQPQPSTSNPMGNPPLPGGESRA